MKISDLLSPMDVLIDVRVSNKRLLLQELAAKAADSLRLPVDQVAPFFSNGKSSDRPGWAAAWPSRTPGWRMCSDPTGCSKLKTPIEFDAIDGQEVDIVFVLLLPTAEDSGQIGALALVARTLRLPENLVRLRAAKNVSELYSAIA